MLQPNDIIPLGIAPGMITLLVTKNGLNYIPKNCVWIYKNPDKTAMHEVGIYTNSPANCTALRLLGVPPGDIKRAGKLI